MLGGDVGSCGCEVLGCGFDVGGVPGDDGVGEQGEGFALDVLVVVASPSELALVREEELSAEGVEGFSFVELGVDASSVAFVVEVAEDGRGFDDAAVFLDGSGELVLAG